MENIHIKNFKGGHVHFIGIGGISMSGLAEILLLKGYRVSGSDMKDSPILHHLSQKGATVHIGHQASNVEGADLIVYTAAVKEDNPEMIEAAKRQIPKMDRATLLGQIMQTYSHAVAVAGTHGKTTTTSMLSTIMLNAQLDPTILVGGELDTIGGNVRVGNSSYFITEACEYVDSFLKFHPTMAVILNIEEDHLDYFKDIHQIYESFLKFASLVPRKGTVIGCGDDPLVRRLMENLDSHTITFGIKEKCDWMARNITFDELGCATFRAVYKDQDMGYFTLRVPGIHNVYNALASAAAGWAMGISRMVIQDSLSSFHGTHRRFEIKGERDGVTVIDDYAHHPTEIKATLATLQNYPHKRAWCVFQPHTYSRTKALFQNFAEALSGVDEIIITDIYAAREKDTGEVHSRDLAAAVSEKGQRCIYISSFDEIVEYLDSRAEEGDVILTMGAGNVVEIGEKFLNAKRAD